MRIIYRSSLVLHRGESKMKSLIAVSLFVAFVAFVRADDVAEFDDESNEPGYFVSGLKLASFILSFLVDLHEYI